MANSAITGTKPYVRALTDPLRGIILNKWYNSILCYFGLC